jgi:hypothetical protein
MVSFFGIVRLPRKLVEVVAGHHPVGTVLAVVLGIALVADTDTGFNHWLFS